ncbi:MAG TPA: hypothetical protein VFG31_08215, partial [Conexibacter sp.]|nr:hypothetical protein [Conexibacter sp.]
HPEPTEHARYLIALLGPVLVVGGVLLLQGRQVREDLAAAASALSQAVLLAVAATSIVAQQRHVYGPAFTNEPGTTRMVLLTPATLAVAVVVALLAAALLRDQRLLARVANALRETPLSRWIAIAVGALFVLLWLASAFNDDATLDHANGQVMENLPFWSDEAFSVLNGHAPLVDFHAQYGHLWAYLAAGGMQILGTSLGSYAAIMLAGTAGAMAAIFATFRRLVGGAPLALALFLPFVATSFFMENGPPANRYGPANLFSLFPIRYAGPFVLLWLVVRRAQRSGGGTAIPLFAFAGIVAINNLEFGLPAFAATLAALAAASSRSRAQLQRLALDALAGVLVAVMAVSLLTLVVVGSLPHFGMLLSFPRIYANAGFGLLPLPALGFHLVVYATFAAALVVAAVRLLSSMDADDRALTSALAWAGIFGLGAGGYFVGRSHPHVLIDLFSAWALALSLLLLVVVHAIGRRPARRPQLAELLVLAGFGVLACSLAQTPTPWSQIDRIQQTTPVARRVDNAVMTVIDHATHRGEPVALVVPLGHRIAVALGLDNITPYANGGSMMTAQQWTETVAALRRAHGTRILTDQRTTFRETAALLAAAGFHAARQSSAGGGLIEFVAR